MGLLDRWIESLDYEFQVIHSCTRHQSPHSECSKCIDICSEEAIVLKNGKPFIQNEKCTECGYCIAECPVQAVEGFFPKRTIIQNQFVITDDRPPAIRELLGYYKKNVTTIACEQEALNDPWQQTVAEANEMLKALNEVPFSIICKKLKQEEKKFTRRDIFTIWKTEAQTTMKQMAPAKWRFNHEDLALTKYYRDYQFTEVKIDPNKCTLCTACEKLCTKKCFQVNSTDFTISAQSCSGCMLCQDICPEKAITVEERIMSAIDIVLPLYTKECKTCNKDYQTLQEHDEKCVMCKKREEYGTFLK